MALLEEDDSEKNSQKCTVNVQKTAWAPFFIVPMSEMNNELGGKNEDVKLKYTRSISLSFFVRCHCCWFCCANHKNINGSKSIKNVTNIECWSWKLYKFCVFASRFLSSAKSLSGFVQRHEYIKILTSENETKRKRFFLYSRIGKALSRASQKVCVSVYMVVTTKVPIHLEFNGMKSNQLFDSFCTEFMWERERLFIIAVPILRACGK